MPLCHNVKLYHYYTIILWVSRPALTRRSFATVCCKAAAVLL